LRSCNQRRRLILLLIIDAADLPLGKNEQFAVMAFCTSGWTFG
jgi:hypothetical protein